MLSGGHARNALPQTALANVNCRIFRGKTRKEVRRTLERVASDPQVKITTVSQLAPDGKVVPVPPSPLLPEVTQAMEKVLSITWPGVPLVATMSTGGHGRKSTRASPASRLSASPACFLTSTTIASMGKTSVSASRTFTTAWISITGL